MDLSKNDTELKDNASETGVTEKSLSWRDFRPHIIFFSLFALFVLIAVSTNNGRMGGILGYIAGSVMNPVILVSLCIGFLVWNRYLLFILLMVLAISSSSYYFYKFYSFAIKHSPRLVEGYDVFYLLDRITYTFVAYLLVGYAANILSLILFRRAFLKKKQNQ